MNRFKNGTSAVRVLCLAFFSALHRFRLIPARRCFHIVIDTDGAADDLRTLCMLLGNREAEVLAVVSSDGALPPAGDIPSCCCVVAWIPPRGHSCRVRPSDLFAPPAWRARSSRVDWGDTDAVPDAYPAATDLRTRVRSHIAAQTRLNGGSRNGSVL